MSAPEAEMSKAKVVLAGDSRPKRQIFGAWTVCKSALTCICILYVRHWSLAGSDSAKVRCSANDPRVIMPRPGMLAHDRAQAVGADRGQI